MTILLSHMGHPVGTTMDRDAAVSRAEGVVRAYNAAAQIFWTDTGKLMAHQRDRNVWTGWIIEEVHEL